MKGSAVLKYDKPLVAALIGFASTIPYEIFTRILLLFGMGKYSLYQLDSLVVTINRPSTTMGLIVSFAVGGVLGVILYYALEKVGTDYIVVKATFLSVFVWVILELIFTSVIEGKTIDIRPMSDYYSKMFGSIAFGVTQGWLLKKFLIKNPNPQNPRNKKDTRKIYSKCH